MEKLHALCLCCPRCKKKSTILDLSSRADGTIFVEMICVVCGIFLNYTTTGAKMVARATIADIEEENMMKQASKNPCKSLALRAPLADPIAKQFDTEWLKDLGVSQDEPPGSVH